MSRILNFPEGYPDEDFRSIVYRHHIRAGNVSMDETNKDLFDVKSEKLLQFPRRLSTLLSRLPYGHNLTEDHFLSNTWFPLIIPFLSKERLSLVYNDILNGVGPKYVGRIVSQRQLPILSRQIKYCPLCVEQDSEVYGESYLHLSHQLSFIKICPKHRTKLYESCPKCGINYSNKDQGYLTVQPCCRNIEIQQESVDEIEELKIKLMNEMVYFRNNSSNLCHDMLHSKIMILLGTNGYIDIVGNIDKKRLIKNIEGFYGKGFLSELRGSNDTFLTQTSLFNFLNPGHMTRFILLYFLVILFLSGSIKKFLGEREVYSCPIPFGTGPWECYNPICPSKEVELPITKCKRNYIFKGNFKGYFTCPICSCTYTRKWFHTNAESDQISITDMGSLWQEKVIKLFNERHNIPYIANVLKSKESTVRTFLKKKDMNLEESKIDVTSKVKEDVREIYRAKVNALLETYDNLKRVDIKRRAYKEYRWLIKNDNEWFNTVLPPSSGKRPPLDYEAVDIELTLKVRAAAAKVYAENPPTQIKKTSIINKLNTTDRSRINNYHNKLPETIKELGLLAESIDEYQIRHTPVLFSKILNSGGYRRVTFKSLCSHRKSYSKCTDETRKRIEKILDELQKDNT